MSEAKQYLISETHYVCEGTTHHWHGNYYNIEGAYYDSLKTTLDADSIFELKLYKYPTYHWFAKSSSEFNADNEKLEASWANQGDYYVAVVAEDENGCFSDSSYFYFLVEVQNSIVFNNSKSIKTYPNPVSKELTIEHIPNVIVEIIDVFGNILIKSNEKIIDVTELPSGIYLLYIKDEDNQPIRIEKLIKK